MPTYIVLVWNRQDTSDRYYLRRANLEEAMECARNMRTERYFTEVFEAKQVY